MRIRKNCGIQCHVAWRLISITYLLRLTGQSQRAKKQCRNYHGDRDISRNNSIHSPNISIPNIKYRRQSETAWETNCKLLYLSRNIRKLFQVVSLQSAKCACLLSYNLDLNFQGIALHTASFIIDNTEKRLPSYIFIHEIPT